MTSIPDERPGDAWPSHRPRLEAVTDSGVAEDAAPESEEGRRLRLVPASRIRTRVARWLWTNRIPAGSLTLVPGREGIGKSLLLAWLCAQITRGELPGQYEGEARPVIYAASEDSWAHTIGPRLIAAGADLDLVYRVDIQDAGTADLLSLPRDCAALGVEIERLGAGLLAADPLLSLIDEGIDTHNDRSLRMALEPLVRMADTSGCAVVGLAHFNKSASVDALSLITGSRAFSAVARAVIAIARDPDDPDGTCVMSQAKNNLGPLDLPSQRYIVETATVPTDEGQPTTIGRLRFIGESTRSVADILSTGPMDTEERTERDEAADWLTEHLAAAGGEASRESIVQAARKAGIAERTLKRARNRAGVISTRSGFPARAVWRIDDGDSTSPESQSGHSRASPSGTRTTGLTGPTEDQAARLTENQSHTATGNEAASPGPDEAPELF